MGLMAVLQGPYGVIALLTLSWHGWGERGHFLDTGAEWEKAASGQSAAIMNTGEYGRAHCPIAAAWMPHRMVGQFR